MVMVNCCVSSIHHIATPGQGGIVIVPDICMLHCPAVVSIPPECRRPGRPLGGVVDGNLVPRAQVLARRTAENRAYGNPATSPR